MENQREHFFTRFTRFTVAFDLKKSSLTYIPPLFYVVYGRFHDFPNDQPLTLEVWNLQKKEEEMKKK